MRNKGNHTDRWAEVVIGKQQVYVHLFYEIENLLFFDRTACVQQGQVSVSAPLLTSRKVDRQDVLADNLLLDQLHRMPEAPCLEQ